MRAGAAAFWRREAVRKGTLVAAPSFRFPSLLALTNATQTPPLAPSSPPPRSRDMPIALSEPRRVWLATVEDNERYNKCYCVSQIGM